MDRHHHLHRRSFLRSAGAVTLSLGLPGVAGAASALPLANFTQWNGKILILIELFGGNDSLNMVAPIHDRTYHELRAMAGGVYSLRETDIATFRGIDRRDNREYGFNKGLQPLEDAWKSGHMKVALDVGYVGSAVSHFQGSALWQKAVTYDSVAEVAADDANGWIERLFSTDPAAMAAGAPHVHPIAGNPAISLDAYSVTARGIGGLPVALSGPGVNALTFAASSQGSTARRPTVGLPSGAAAYGPVYDFLRAQGVKVTDQISVLDGLTDAPCTKNRFVVAKGNGAGDLSASLKFVANILARGINVPFISLAMNASFDTHVKQLPAHEALLRQVALAVSDFRAATMELPGANGGTKWDDIVIMTHSEFGRTLKPNNGEGFDHGAGGSQLLFGGSLTKANTNQFVGYMPALADAAAVNPWALAPMMDFRSLYAGILEGHFGMPPSVREAVFVPKLSAYVTEAKADQLRRWIAPAPIFAKGPEPDYINPGLAKKGA